MAEGARRALGSDWGVGITGVAGPGGGSEVKPVGTVHLAVAAPRDGEVEHRQVRLPGDRDRVRRFATQILLEMLRRRLIAVASGTADGSSGRP
jgi:nicotinamide-nucleotide amidase